MFPPEKMFSEPLSYQWAESHAGKSRDRNGGGQRKKRDTPSPASTVTVRFVADDRTKEQPDDSGYRNNDQPVQEVRRTELLQHDAGNHSGGTFPQRPGKIADQQKYKQHDQSR